MPTSHGSAAELLSHLGPQVFVSDFDGTMTAVDFYDVVLNHVPADSMPDYWGRCVAGELTHVEALSKIFQHAPHDVDLLKSWLPETRLDPETPAAIEALRQAGWDLLVVSAGCEWYIGEILAPVRGQVQIIANPGDISPTDGLWMGWPPVDAPWHSPHFGVDKARIVQLLQQMGKTVAFAGDGRPDLSAAKAVSGEYRFAKSWLAEQLDAAGLPFHGFNDWSETARILASSASVR